MWMFLAGLAAGVAGFGGYLWWVVKKNGPWQ